MHKILSSIIVAVVGLVALPSLTLAQGVPAQHYPLYRLYNAAKDDHFYTASLEEAEAVKAQGYLLEATYNALSARVVTEDQLPLYRLYDSQLKRHFYTDNNDEMAILVLKKGGFTLEGTLGFLAGTSSVSGTSLYRLYNPSSGDHLYTNSWVEWGMVQLSGWRDEGSLLGRLYE